MARNCSICVHPEREAIDRALTSRTAQRTIADHYGVSKTCLVRHSAHIAQVLARPAPIELGESTSGILAHLQRIVARCERYEQEAADKGLLSTALGAIREQTRVMEVLLRAAEARAERAAAVEPAPGLTNALEALEHLRAVVIPRLEARAVLEAKPAETEH